MNKRFFLPCLFLLLLVCKGNQEITKKNSNLLDCNSIDLSLSLKSFYLSENNSITLTNFIDGSDPVEAFHKWNNAEISKIKEGIALYNNGNSDEAIPILSKFHKKNPKDLFLHAQLARAHYKKYPNDYLQRIKYAFPIYEDLIQKVERETRKQDDLKDPNQIVVNLDFVDDYWKTASLYLDKKDYLKAKKLIQKVLIGFFSNNRPENHKSPFIEQVYQYMTEVEYFLKNRNENQFYYCKTLQVNPGNIEINSFLMK